MVWQVAGLWSPGLSHRQFYRSLQSALVEMVAPLQARSRVDAPVGGRKHVLPSPLLWCIRIFPRQRERQVDGAEAITEILLVDLPEGTEMSLLKAR